MNVQFIDRLLRCSDCHGEFIFTAGEQLFFQDKQFKNDPKRCKPCKSRRTGLAAAANGAGPAAAGLSRTETRTMCSECNVETTVPFKPTQGRPVLCRQCFQAKSRAVPVPVASMPMAAMTMAAVPSAATLSALTSMSARSDGATLSAEAALVAASSMASASAASSVASAADLLSISEMSAEVGSTPELVPTEILAAARAVNVPAGLMAAMAEAGDA